MAYFKIVHDENELRTFHDLLTKHPIKKHCSYFISMSARNKYLSDEEKRQIDLGRTEMFSRKIVPDDDFSTYKRIVYSYETNKKALMLTV